MVELKKAALALEKHGFTAKCFETAKEARTYILERIPADASVGCGGSMTLLDAGITQALMARGNEVYSHEVALRAGEPLEVRLNIMKKANVSDFYLSSANALTKTGEIINTDGRGNRVSALSYGPKNLIFVIGKNKLTEDIASGLLRVHAVAAPKNTKRLSSQTPCAVTGKCADCLSPGRICRLTLIMERPPLGTPAEVILINEDYGF